MRVYGQPARAWLIVFILLAACDRGSTTTNVEQPAEQLPSDDQASVGPKATAVGFSLVQDTLPRPQSCRVALSPPVLADLGEDFALDGLAGEWMKIAPFVKDPSGDSFSPFDLRAVYFAAASGGYAFYVPNLTAPDPEAVLHFEFGGALIRGGGLQQNLVREYRVENGHVATKIGSVWQLMNEQDARFVFGADGFELWLGQRELESALFYPSWYMRAYSKNADGWTNDATAAGYAASTLGSDHSQFVVRGCEGNRNGDENFAFVEVRQNFSDEVREQQLVEQTQLAFGAVRLAFDHWSVVSGRRVFPQTILPVLMTDADVMPVSYQDRRDSPQQMARGVAINIRNLAPTSPATYEVENIYDQAIQQIIDIHLEAKNPAAPEYLRIAVRQALRASVLQRRVSLQYWLDGYPQTPADFLRASDQDAPQSLAERFATIDLDQSAVTLSKARSLGELLASVVGPETLLNAWEILASEAVIDPAGEAPGLRFMEILRHSQPAAADKIAGMTSGWLNNAAYDTAFAPGVLADTDFDGVPDYYEVLRGTSPVRVDTDGDGWSDLAEIVTGKDPLRPAVNPGAIVVDGYFGDWQELLPGRLNIDEGTSAGGCPKSADITHYAALIAGDTLVVGAHGKDFWALEPRVRWEAALDFPEAQRSIVLRAVRGDFAYEILDGKTLSLLKRYKKGFPQGISSVEWSLGGSDLGFSVDLRKPGAVKVRLATIYEGPQRVLCDETVWFDPMLGAGKN